MIREKRFASILRLFSIFLFLFISQWMVEFVVRDEPGALDGRPLKTRVPRKLKATIDAALFSLTTTTLLFFFSSSLRTTTARTLTYAN